MSRVAYPEMAAVDPHERESLMVLRSLIHCRVIRVWIGHAPTGFRILQTEGYLNAKRVSTAHADCRLNARGLEFAAKALKKGQNHGDEDGQYQP